MFGPCFRVCRHLASDAAPKQAFSWAAAETEAKDASVSLVITSVRARCRACATETESDDAVVVCRSCGGLSFDLVQGNEMILEAIEYTA
jgi:Zn finger protein HypA/HybF involved in hydrogenase expression